MRMPGVRSWSAASGAGTGALWQRQAAVAKRVWPPLVSSGVNIWLTCTDKPRLLNPVTSLSILKLEGALTERLTSPSHTPTKRLSSPSSTRAYSLGSPRSVMYRTPLPRLLPSLAALRSSRRMATSRRRNTRLAYSWAQACGRRRSLLEWLAYCTSHRH
jgi:hypothetical protein